MALASINRASRVSIPSKQTISNCTSQRALKLPFRHKHTVTISQSPSSTHSLLSGRKNTIEMDTVASMVAERPVVIFSRSTCCMCHSIKALICSFGANPTVYELDQIPNGQQVERTLRQLGGSQQSIPAVFIGQEFVGGDKQILSLQIKNQLGPLLKSAGAIWI